MNNIPSFRLLLRRVGSVVTSCMQAAQIMAERVQRWEKVRKGEYEQQSAEAAERQIHIFVETKSVKPLFQAAKFSLV